jgi:hypothetical protein
MHDEPSQNCSSPFFTWANNPTKKLGYLLFYILMINRGWPCPTDSFKGRTHSNHPFSFRPAIHMQKAILKIKSTKIKCFWDFPSPNFAQNLRKITKSPYIIQVIRPKKKRMLKKNYFPI